MRAEISFDFVMQDDMSFVEGTYRLPAREWQVFIFGPDASVTAPEPRRGKWPSGITGVFVKWPPALTLNKASVLETLSRELGVTEWIEMSGPDSIQLR